MPDPQTTIPHIACNTPNACRREQVCLEPWRCSHGGIDAAKWTHPYLIRLKNPVEKVPAGTVGTVIEHWADGKAAEVEFPPGSGGNGDPCVETVRFEDMENVDN